MRITDLIASKRDGGSLSRSEIEYLISGVVDGTVADYQTSAWLMAACLAGLSDEETLSLTLAMRDSGRTLSWSAGRPVVDKHSTGGVGDKVSLVLAPLAASCELRVPMVSGRSLGHTGGTLDKLESIPGFTVDLPLDRFVRQVEDLGLGMIGQTAELAPADRRIYALRDATATVPSEQLICASILSKKLAEGLEGLVLDVKVGSGAFMADVASARSLGERLVRTAGEAGCPASALLTRMSVPLGMCAGNALEVFEVLRGGGPPDTRRVSIRLVSEMLAVCGPEGTLAEERIPEAVEALDSGRALSLFERMVEAQQGDLGVFERTMRASAPLQHELRFERSGRFSGLDAGAVGETVRDLGGGRYRMDDRIDHSVGWEQACPPGRDVSAGELLGIVHAASESDAEGAASVLRASVRWDRPLDDLIVGVI